MRNERLIFQGPHGVACVVEPISDEPIEVVAQKSIPAGTPYIQVDVSELPKDRDFRNAWMKGLVGVDIDIPKARGIHRDNIRGARNPKFAELDVESVRATEDGDDVKLAAIKTAKQKLRDAPADPAIEQAATLEEIKATWPAGELGETPYRKIE